MRAAWIFIILSTLLFVPGCQSPDGEASDQPPVVYDLEDQPVAVADGKYTRSTVLVFLKTDCPIGNRYAPKIMALAREFEQGKMAFQLVYPDTDLKSSEVRAHLEEYNLELPAVRDPDRQLVKLAGATRMPESVVFDEHGKQVYRGRIDDQYVDFGKARPSATTDDLRDVLLAIQAGRAVEPRITEAVGCYIE